MKKLSMLLYQTQGIIKFCEEINAELVRLKLTRKTTGGYLTIVERDTGAIVLTILIGTLQFERTAKHRRLSIEQAKRVFDEKLSSSFQNRNIEQGKSAGAVSGEKFIYSFSGHCEEINEVVSILSCIENEQYLNPEFQANLRQGEDPKPMDVILKKMDLESKFMMVSGIRSFISKIFVW